MSRVYSTDVHCRQSEPRTFTYILTVCIGDSSASGPRGSRPLERVPRSKWGARALSARRPLSVLTLLNTAADCRRLSADATRI